ncbi:SIMPL domain-containing protein [Microbacterium sp. 1P10UB]|uniref:SIMPL domain-containing protein n=1 Tax=unclassified Microbacterium TaxID=2609290 RepID=UPI0039A138A9
MADVIITVRGEHETRIAPERGIARITVRGEGPERAPVLERVAALALPLRDDLAARQAAGTIVEWSSGRAAVWSDRPWNADGTRLAPVHYATIDISATFSDVAALSAWLSDVAERDGVQVGGVDWILTPTTRAAREQEVATEAVQVAVARATAYARAIGRETVTPVQIADVGLLGGGDAPGMPASPKMMRAAFAAMDASSGPAMQFQPEDITLTAAVEARFTAS